MLADYLFIDKLPNGLCCSLFYGFRYRPFGEIVHSCHYVPISSPCYRKWSYYVYSYPLKGCLWFDRVQYIIRFEISSSLASIAGLYVSSNILVHLRPIVPFLDLLENSFSTIMSSCWFFVQGVEQRYYLIPLKYFYFFCSCFSVEGCLLPPEPSTHYQELFLWFALVLTLRYLSIPHVSADLFVLLRIHYFCLRRRVVEILNELISILTSHCYPDLGVVILFRLILVLLSKY